MFQFLLAALILLLTACEGSGLRGNIETVLAPGTRLEAANANGTIIITAGEGTRRTFEGDGWKKTIRMTARAERWNGSLGLYYPGTRAGNGRVVMAEEGRIHVNSVEDALRYLEVSGAGMKPVFTSTGLVFGYSVAEPFDPETQPEVHSIQIWQIYVQGKRPTTMPYADNEAITITGEGPPDTSEPHPAPVGYEMLLDDELYKPATRSTTRPTSESVKR